MKIIMGNDHSATDLKNRLKDYIISKGHEVTDVGTHDHERTDYPIYGRKAYEAFSSMNADKLIVVCGSGVGISVSVSKAGGECVLVDSVAGVQKANKLIKSNQFGIGARTTTYEIAIEIVNEILRS